jgi:hypothetical protein
LSKRRSSYGGRGGSLSIDSSTTIVQCRRINGSFPQVGKGALSSTTVWLTLLVQVEAQRSTCSRIIGALRGWHRFTAQRGGLCVASTWRPSPLSTAAGDTGWVEDAGLTCRVSRRSSSRRAQSWPVRAYSPVTVGGQGRYGPAMSGPRASWSTRRSGLPQRQSMDPGRPERVWPQFGT